MDADKLLLGYTHPEIHLFMDSFVKQWGPQHRQINHVWPVIEAMGLIWGKEGENVAMLHIMLDLKIIDSDYIMELIKEDRNARRKKKGKSS